MTVMLSAFPAGSPGRLASTRVRGVAETVPCFDWCVTDHGHTNVFHLADVNHFSDDVRIAVPRSGGVREVLSARVLAYPHEDAAPTIVVDSADECDELDAQQVEALADQLITAASKLRGLARTIGGAR